MVLGAGLGTRLRPFTNFSPKSLIPVLGVPCAEFAFLQLADAGVTHSVINGHSHYDQMKSYCESKPFTDLRIELSDESQSLLGSAGGYRYALKKMGKTAFIGMNADTLNHVNLNDLWTRHQKLRAERKVVMTLALLSGEWLQAQTGQYRKIEINESTGLINGYSSQLLRHTPFWTGVAIFEPEAFESLPEGKPAEFVPEVLEPWIRKKRVGYLMTDTLWMDIGSPELWWRAHFDLYERYLNHALPESWTTRIRPAIQRCKINLAERTVDYPLDGVSIETLGKNSIRYHNQTYAISNLGNF